MIKTEIAGCYSFRVCQRVLFYVMHMYRLNSLKSLQPIWSTLYDSPMIEDFEMYGKYNHINNKRNDYETEGPG